MRPPGRGCVMMPRGAPISTSPRRTNFFWWRSEHSCVRWYRRACRNSVSGNESERAMIAVIFEVWPKPEHKQEYLDLAAELKPILQTIDGFISVERFESLTEKGKILSLSFFRDEAAVAAWRNVPEHRRTQGKGRAA